MDENYCFFNRKFYEKRIKRIREDESEIRNISYDNYEFIDNYLYNNNARQYKISIKKAYHNFKKLLSNKFTHYCVSYKDGIYYRISEKKYFRLQNKYNYYYRYFDSQYYHIRDFNDFIKFKLAIFNTEQFKNILSTVIFRDFNLYEIEYIKKYNDKLFNAYLWLRDYTYYNHVFSYIEHNVKSTYSTDILLLTEFGTIYEVNKILENIKIRSNRVLNLFETNFKVNNYPISQILIKKFFKKENKINDNDILKICIFTLLLYHKKFKFLNYNTDIDDYKFNSVDEKLFYHFLKEKSITDPWNYFNLESFDSFEENLEMFRALCDINNDNNKSQYILEYLL